ncbi:MAG TPA: phosphatase PAP2 family protein [Woeseiaceae bacterium]|nr:phosphatase PAP2 family protein [Woeseiaceae bacterium]
MSTHRTGANLAVRLFQWIGSHELAVLGALLGVALLIFGFVRLAALATGEGQLEIDARLLMALREPEKPDDPLGPAWVEEAARDITALGSTTVLALLLIAACCYLLLRQKWRTALFVLLAILGGAAMSFFLKSGFDRPRPDLVAHQAQVFTSSFPSSHAMASAVTFLTLGALLARAEPSRRLKAYIMGTAALLTLIVGASRVYLGVHWPSDVLAGWVAGAAWALAAWLLARLLQSRRTLDEEPPED